MLSIFGILAPKSELIWHERASQMLEFISRLADEWIKSRARTPEKGLYHIPRLDSLWYVSLAHPRGAFCCEKLIPEFLSALTILLPPPDEEEEANERIIADNPPPNDDVNFAATMKCERFPKYFFIICILIAQLAGLMYGKLDSERGFRGWKKDPEVTSNKVSPAPLKTFESEFPLKTWNSTRKTLLWRLWSAFKVHRDSIHSARPDVWRAQPSPWRDFHSIRRLETRREIHILAAQRKTRTTLNPINIFFMFFNQICFSGPILCVSSLL